jgi:hypothetical protein
MKPEQESFEKKESVINPELVKENDGLDAIRGMIEKVKTAKRKMTFLQEQVGAFGDASSADHADLAEFDNTIKTETANALKEIDRRFDLIEDEIKKAGEIKSSSGKVYKYKDIRAEIDIVRQKANLSQRPDSDFITRANNLRDRVGKLADLILEIKSK